MAPSPQCSALAAAKERKGACSSSHYYPTISLDAISPDMLTTALTSLCFCYPGLSYGQIASQLGTSEQHVVDSTFLSSHQFAPSLTAQMGVTNPSLHWKQDRHF